MAATTTLLGLVTPTQGTLTGTWGDTVNYGITDYVDIAIAGTLTLTGDSPVTLANTTGSSSGNSIGATTAQYAIIRVTGTFSTTKIITAPSYSKTYLVVNASSAGTVSFIRSGQVTAVSIATNETALVYYNGTDYVKVVGTATAGAAGGSTTQVQYNNAGVLAGITGATTNGTALTLVAPVLGTPASGTVTNLTGTASININGTVGATTPTTGAFTTLSATDVIKQTGNPSLAAAGATEALVAHNTGYGAVLYGQGTTYDVALLDRNTNPRLTVTTVGAAVTGTLSATGTLSGGTSGTAYSFSGSAPATSLTLDASGNLAVGSSANGTQMMTTLQGYSTNSVNGSYGSLLFSANANYTGGAHRYLLTNAYNATDFAIISSVNSTTTPTLDSGGAVSSGTAVFSLNTSANAVFSGNIGLGATTPTTSGTGITFPATQSASSNANTLDDYEEGTWTATFLSDGGSITTSSTVRYGFYTKIGRQVTVNCQVQASAISSPTGDVYIQGLPFAASSATGYTAAAAVTGFNLAATAIAQLNGIVGGGLSLITINRYSAGTQSSVSGDFQSNTVINATVTYFTS